MICQKKYATSHYDTIEVKSGPSAPLISSSTTITSFIVSKTELLAAVYLSSVQLFS